MIEPVYNVLGFVDNGQIPMIIFINRHDKIFLPEYISLRPSADLIITTLRTGQQSGKETAVMPATYLSPELSFL
jgi:hypothetical protein